MEKKKLAPSYTKLLGNIGNLLQTARQNVYYQINEVLVKTYWSIGKHVVDFEQKGEARATYGTGLLKQLAEDLTSQFGRGFSERNIEQMRNFYQLFPIPQTLSAKLSWSHYCLLLRIDEPLSRDFYHIETEKEGWSVRELRRQINSALFERLALSKDKEAVLKLAEKGQIIEKPEDSIKDPYILEFLGLEEKSSFTESDLEQRIIDNLGKFLLEIGKGFSFVARQRRITLENEHFFVDLVFYNRLLRCFVIFELKLGELQHQDLGQLQMYVNYYDREIKQADENPTIGVLLCADKKKSVVEYTLPKDNTQIFASQYKLYLPDKRLLREQIKKVIEDN
jgi:predicted nuclease of restriction endonuclease-like (RecB) superfamily